MGQLSLAQGNQDQAVAYFSKETAKQKTAIVFYWLSAGYSAKGDQDKSVAAMQESLKLGFRDFSAIDNSPYFASLRADPRYLQLVQQYRK
jgi:hypothetical protein